MMAAEEQHYPNRKLAISGPCVSLRHHQQGVEADDKAKCGLREYRKEKTLDQSFDEDYSEMTCGNKEFDSR